MVATRRLVTAEPCESCGTPVRVAQYEGGQPRLNEVRDGRDMPGGHTPDDCREQRGRAGR